MTRLMMALSLALVLAFAPLTDAKSSSSSGSSSDGGYQGQIQSVTTTNFAMGSRGGRHRRRGGASVQVHYNPSTTTVTIDGTVVNSLDYKATGKYAVVSGKMVNNILEATSISVTSTAPARHRKSKSQ